MNTITMSLALEQGRLVLSYVVRNDKLWEISGSTKTLIDKMLTDRKNQTKHKQEIQSLSDRIDNFSLKFTAFKEQLEKDFQDFNRAISYYIRNKDGAIKEPLNVNLHSVTYSNQQNSVYGHSKKLEKCLADFVNTTAEFWEILRFAFAERLNTKAERNFITFIKNNKKLIGDNFDYAKSFIKLWGSRKHQQDIRLSSFNFENNIFTEPKLITIRSKKFNQILLPKFIENILDYTIFLIGELER